jgi:hypothetical protein
MITPMLGAGTIKNRACLAKILGLNSLDMKSL